MIGVKLCVFFCLFVIVYGQIDRPRAETKYGGVEGKQLVLHNGNTVNSFLGIPFAAPPVGDRRWQPPEEPSFWGEMNATSLGSACMQTLTSMVQTTHPGWTDFDEDCLNVNIYTPGDMSSGPYPVMMWIHGGAYAQGANIMYPGYFYAGLHDVVVVVPNYRVGVLGFATTNDEVMPGNYGMLDLVLALEFIQENIASFGGNPDQVTVFGESAGARATGMLLMSPLAQGLFHGAIQQSGNELAYRAIHHEGEEPEDYVRQIAEQTNCTTDDTQDMVDCLRDIAPRRLISLDVNCKAGFHCNGYIPHVDGYFLPDTPQALRARGEYNKVAQIAGLCSEDGFFFIPGFLPQSLVRGLDREEFVDFIDESIDWLSPSFPEEDREEDIKEAIKFFYTHWPDPQNEERNREMAGRIYTDYTYGYPAEVQANLHSEDADTYFFVFNYRSLNASAPEWMGATHSSDISFVLGDPYFNLNDAVRADSKITVPKYHDDRDMEMSDFIMEMWTNFAKTGNPTPSSVIPPNSDEDVMWEKYTNERRAYMWLSDLSYTSTDYKAQEHAFWEHYIHWLAAGKPMP